MPRWMRRRPLLLAAALAGVNRLRRLGAPRSARPVRTLLAAAAAVAVGVLPLLFLFSTDTAARAVRWSLTYAWLVFSISALYAASLTARRRREAEDAGRRSWLAATPLVDSRSGNAGIPLVLLPLLARLALAIGLALALGASPAVAAGDALRLGALLAIGGTTGSLGGWWVTRTPRAARAEGSRYVARPKQGAPVSPSAAALSAWPIAQAFAASRPENARLAVLAAILSVPGDAGLVGGTCILAVWFVASYLATLLMAVPRVARAAAEWLRSTPIDFWSFAWPLLRRALAHQVCGTAVALAFMMLLGTTLSAALYLGALWLALVALTAAVSLADCYRARSPVVKTTLSVAAALLAEQRARGWGIALALAVAAWHFRTGGVHERA
ncbi:MAG TPA: hypothetical protein VFV10_08420 [Gammaproteobacteria bacterium]|nr:hypothetical protein [Gammaproteobacteria bacterium]